jgi:hypothetical protein
MLHFGLLHLRHLELDIQAKPNIQIIALNSKNSTAQHNTIDSKVANQKHPEYFQNRQPPHQTHPVLRKL